MLPRECSPSLFVLSCATLLVRCGSESPASPGPPSAVGHYQMISVAGQAPPVVVEESPATGFKQELMGGSADLRADGTCTAVTTYRYTVSGSTYTSDSRDDGRWTISGNTVTLTFGSDQLSATLAGDLLTVRADVELVYRRQ